ALKDQQLAAAFEMLPPVRLVDNLRHSQPSDVCYRVYAGDANAQFPLLSIAIQLAFLNSSISPPLIYPNDLAVNQTSAELVNHYNPLVSAILPILYPHVSIHHTVDIHAYHPRLGDAVRTFVCPDTFFEEELRNNLGSSSCPAREGVTTPAGLPDPENVPVPSLETLFARSEPTGISSSVNITATTLQNGQIVSGQFDIESAGVHRVQLAWPEGAVDFALTTPYGQEVSRYTADGDPNATYLHLDTGFGLLTTYVVTTTVGGAWSYEITVNDVPTDTLVAATLYPATPIGLNVSQPNWVTQGITQTITATLSYSATTPILGATVAGTITLPDDSQIAVSLFDDGNHDDGAADDGVYGVQQQFSGPGGLYSLVITATGSYSGELFTRNHNSVIMVATTGSALTGNYSDRGIDTTGDGRFEYLAVGVEIDVSEASTYTLSASLYQGTTFIGHSNLVFHAEPGTVTPELLFAGADIIAAGLDGPYDLRNLMLADTAGATILIDVVDEPYTTGAYTVQDFVPLKRVFLPIIN
ncbi:MAG: hypothetical protein KDE28_25445, partial [Anaerolineales bacterium]|nr:hypothetical protein [Anaerolineales bacterium]